MHRNWQRWRGQAGGQGAVALLALLLVGLGAGRAAGASWSLEGFGLLGLPVSPSAFMDGWNSGWGLGGGVHHGLGGRTAVGFEGLYQQFGLGDIDGESLGGGTRRWSSLRIPVRYYVWEDLAGGSNFAFTASAGYTHQSIEPISGAENPPRSGNADGFAWSAGLRFSHPLRAESRFVVGLEYGSAIFEHETPGAVALRVGIATPLHGTPPAP